MKETNWDDCLNNKARKITPDLERAKSLLGVAKERMNLFDKVTKINCNFIFEDYYTSLIEVIQSTAFKEGFNILNHVCLGYFLRDFMKRNDLFLQFEDLRYKRNSLTYYGNKMEFLIAKDVINKCEKLINELS